MSLLLLTGCAPACEDAPLAPPREPPSFLAELSQRGSLADAGPLDAPSSTLVLYGAEGRVASDRWLDSLTRWAGARGAFDAHDALPWHQAPGRVIVTIDEPPTVLIFDPASGELVREIALPIGGAPIDLAFVDSLAVVSRTDGLVVVELASGTTRSIDLQSLADARPMRIAPFIGTPMVAVGLARATGLPGAVAIVDAESGAASLLELPGLRGCEEVAAMPSRSDQVAVLCGGEVDEGSRERRDPGLALLELGETVRVVVTQSGFTPAPTEGLVGMGDGWVAALARGSETERDRLLAIDLDTGVSVVLREEPWSPQEGPALGEGAFDPATGELWWPSVELGIARFSQDALRYSPLPPVRPPLCQRAPIRRLRQLP